MKLMLCEKVQSFVKKYFLTLRNFYQFRYLWDSEF